MAQNLFSLVGPGTGGGRASKPTVSAAVAAATAALAPAEVLGAQRLLLARFGVIWLVGPSSPSGEGSVELLCRLCGGTGDTGKKVLVSLFVVCIRSCGWPAAFFSFVGVGPSHSLCLFVCVCVCFRVWCRLL